MTTKKPPLLVKLRKSHAPLAALIHIGMDYILQRPVRELFNTAELAKAAAIGIRSVAAEPGNEALLEQQIRQSLKQLQQAELQDAEFEGKLPERTVEVIRALIAQPFALDEDLVAELLDHSAARFLLREVIQLSLLRFSRRVAERLPGGTIVSQFANTFRGFAALTVGSEGVTVEKLINGSVEDSLSPALRLTAERLADEDFATEVADWRGHIVNVLLDQPVKGLLGPLDQIEPRALALQLTALLQSIADWNNLEEVIEKSVAAVLERAGDESLGNLLRGAAKEKDLRPIVEQQLVKTLWPFVRSPEFEEWLNEFMGSE